MKNLEKQFTELVNGGENIIGTNGDIRSWIWEGFVSEYHNGVTLDIDGAIITFTANHSISGKTTTYLAGITKAQYIWINGSAFGLSNKKEPSIGIEFGTIYIYGGGKFYRKIENSRVNSIIKPQIL